MKKLVCLMVIGAIQFSVSTAFAESLLEVTGELQLEENWDNSGYRMSWSTDRKLPVKCLVEVTSVNPVLAAGDYGAEIEFKKASALDDLFGGTALDILRVGSQTDDGEKIVVHCSAVSDSYFSHAVETEVANEIIAEAMGENRVIIKE